MRQTDLFEIAPASIKLRAQETPDPNTIRVRLHAMLALVRDAAVMPWEPPRARAQEHLFVNMAAWLPPEERDALRRDFAAQMSRLREIRA
ncbi:MAG: hypothetical protein ACREET_17955 [Stellaceae bacterium]